MSEKNNHTLAEKYKWKNSGSKKTDAIKAKMENGSRKTRRAKDQEEQGHRAGRTQAKDGKFEDRGAKKFKSDKYEDRGKKSFKSDRYEDRDRKNTRPDRYEDRDRRSSKSDRYEDRDRKNTRSDRYEDRDRRSSKSDRYDDRDRRNSKSGRYDDRPQKNSRSDQYSDQAADRKPRDPDTCPYARKCGSCSFQGTPYDKQLKIKQQKVDELLGEFGKVHPIIGMKDPKHYRNKVHAVFDIQKGGTIISGVYEAGTHNVVNIEECQIEDEISNQIIKDIRGLLRSFKIKTYDEDTGYGLLRHVLIRRGFTSGEVMVVLVLGTPILPSKNNFVKALLKLHPEITTIVINVNNRRTSMILGDKETTIYGKGYIEDTLCGYTFRISPKSFYQVNPVQTEILYNKAMEFAGLKGKERVVDAYSGIGTIGIVASRQAKEVISVELNKDAVRDAVKNAKINDINNISFYQKDAGEFLVEMADQEEKVDVVFMDPPRAGSDENFLKSIAHMYPKKVVYISCNPETLARDLDYITELDYKVTKIQPVDMFPFTSHCEVVCLLESTLK